MAGGPVAHNWTSFVLSTNKPVFENAGNEGYDPNGSQYIWRDLGKWRAGIYQTVTTLTPGKVYHFWIVWGQALHDIAGNNARATMINRQIGVDLTGGTDPRSPNIQWTVPYTKGSGFNRIEWNLYFKATGTTATFFLRAINSHTDGRNKVFFDTACLYPANNAPTTTPWANVTPPTAAPTFTPTPTNPPSQSTLVDDADPSVTYNDLWTQGTDPKAYKTTYHRGRGVSGHPVVLTYNFTGTQIGIVSVGYRDHGIANVFIDGVKVGTMDQYTPGPVFNLIQTFNGLAPGSHQLQIKNAGQKNPASSDNWLVIDAFIVPPTTGLLQPNPSQFHAVSEIITTEPHARTPTPTPTNAPPRLIPFRLARIPAPTPSDPSVLWDSRLPGLNVSLQTANVAPGTLYWKLIRADYNDPFQHTGDFGGDHEMYYVVTDQQGARIVNQKVWQSWPGDSTSALTKPKGIADIPMWANYFPDRGPGPYSGYMDGLPSDVVSGMGLPANNHVSFILYFQKTIKGSDSGPPSSTPTNTATATFTAIATNTLTPTNSATATFTATPTPSFTPTPTFTRTPTFTPIPSDVPTLTDTPTVVQPTPTFTPTSSDTTCNFGVIKTLTVGVSPKGIAVDASTQRVFVGLANAVAVIDANTLQVIDTFQMNGTATTNGIAFAQGKLFITKRETGRVTILNASNGTNITSVLVGNSPYGIGASGNRVWVANFNDSTVTLINADTNAVISTTAVSLYPALVAPMNDNALVSAWGAGANLLDASNQVDATLALGNGTFGISANSASQKVFTSNRLTKTLSRVNLATNTVEGSATESEAPYAVLLNPTLSHLWVVLADSNRVRVRNTANFGEYQTFAIGAQGANGGDSIGLLNDLVFVANNAAGTVTILRDCAAPKPNATLVPTNTPTRPPAPSKTPTRIPSKTPTPLVSPKPTQAPSMTPTPVGCARRPRLLSPVQDAQLNTRQVLLDWSNVACATYYRVQVVRNSTTNTPLANVRVTPSQYTVTKLPRGSTYYFRVRACDTNSCAPWTNWRSFSIKP